MAKAELQEAGLIGPSVWRGGRTSLCSPDQIEVAGVGLLPRAETPGLTPVLTGIKGNLSSAVNYVTGNYVQITIKVWVLSSSRKVPVYIHKLLLSSSLRLEISGAARELCAPHNMLGFFFRSWFWGYC